eukprot:126195-Chlamydomonas_euryale.AAC.16
MRGGRVLRGEISVRGKTSLERVHTEVHRDALPPCPTGISIGVRGLGHTLLSRRGEDGAQGHTFLSRRGEDGAQGGAPSSSDVQAEYSEGRIL